MTDAIKISKKGAIFRIENNPGQRIPVNLFMEEKLFPAEACAERLVEIASHPAVRENVVVLPDIFCKNKNFIPGGVAIAVEGMLIPMFAGANNDALAVYATGLPVSSLNESNFDVFFREISQNIAVYRSAEPLISKDALWEQLLMPDRDFTAHWNSRLGDLSLFGNKNENGDHHITADEIMQAFPQTRPEGIPKFIPHHDIESAGCASFGVIDGNSHFIEIDRIEEFIDEDICRHLGLSQDEILITVHIGAADVGIIANKQFVNFDGGSEAFEIKSEMGLKYRNANLVAERFGYANRFKVVEGVKKSLETAVRKNTSLKLLSDAPHDMVEPIICKGRQLQLHRKGAVRALPSSAFPTGHPYSVYGKPFLFPSYPGGDSYLMVNSQGNAESFYTCSHGAGRSFSLEDAVNKFSDRELLDLAETIDLRIFSFGKGYLSSQVPAAFKPIDDVLQTLSKMNLSQPIARVKPMALIKT